MSRESIAGSFLAALGGVCWGLSGAMGEYLFTYQGMDSRWLVPIRLFLAGVILLAYSLLRYKKGFLGPFLHKEDVPRFLVYGLLGIASCQFFYFYTIQLSNAAVGAVMQDLSPALILMAICIEERRRPHLYEAACVVMAITGVFLICTHGETEAFRQNGKAIASGIICAFAVLIYNMVPRGLLGKYPVAVLQGWAFLLGGTLFFLLFQSWNIRYVPNAMGIFGIAIVVLVGNVIAFCAYMEGVHLAGPERAILFGFAEPMTAEIMTVCVFGGKFGMADAVGFILILAMLMIISRAQH